MPIHRCFTAGQYITFWTVWHNVTTTLYTYGLVRSIYSSWLYNGRHHIARHDVNMKENDHLQGLFSFCHVPMANRFFFVCSAVFISKKSTRIRLREVSNISRRQTGFHLLWKMVDGPHSTYNVMGDMRYWSQPASMRTTGVTDNCKWWTFLPIPSLTSKDIAFLIGTYALNGKPSDDRQISFFLLLYSLTVIGEKTKENR